MRGVKKPSCWDVMKCGRELATAERPACPAATATNLDGINCGMAAGRCCWAVAGTLCHDKQGTFAVKTNNCLECEFFKRVAREEWPGVMVDS